MAGFSALAQGFGAEAGNISEAMREREAERHTKFQEGMEQSYLKLAQQRGASQADAEKALAAYRRWQTTAPKKGTLDEAQKFAAGMLGYDDPSEVPAEMKSTYDKIVMRRSGVQPVGMTSATLVQDANSPTGWSKVIKSNITGEEITRTAGAAPPAGQTGTDVDHQTYKEVKNADGTTSLVPVTEHTSKRPVGFTAAPAAAGGVTGQPSTISGSGASQRPKPATGRGGGITGKPLTDDDYAAAVKSLQQGLPWKDVTKGWKPASELALQKYMQSRNIAIPKQGAGGAQSIKMVEAGMATLHVSLWGDPQTKTEGLADTLKVLDNSKSRAKLIAAWTFTRNSSTPSFFSRMTPDVINNYLASASISPLSDTEYAYIAQMNRAITAIQGLRTITGLPRSTQLLMDQYVRELPDPMTTNSSDRAKYKLSLIEREVKAALSILNPSQSQGGGDKPLPE